MSQNGWSNDPKTIRLYNLDKPDRYVTVRYGDVAVVFDWLIRRYKELVEPVWTCSGYRSVAVNKRSGGIPNSNHLSATAIDINGYMYPYEAEASQGHWKTKVTGKKLDAVRQILSEAQGVLAWGGDFPVGYRDEMHWEISKHTTVAQVNKFAIHVSTLMRKAEQMLVPTMVQNDADGSIYLNSGTGLRWVPSPLWVQGYLAIGAELKHMPDGSACNALVEMQEYYDKLFVDSVADALVERLNSAPLR